MERCEVSIDGIDRGTSAASGSIHHLLADAYNRAARAPASLQPPLGPGTLQRRAGDRAERHQSPGGGGERERGSRGGAHSGRPAGRDTDEDETKWAIWQLGPQAKCASARLAFRLASGPAHLHLPADLPSPDDRFVPSSRPSPSPYSLAHATVQQRRRGARPNPPPFAEAEDALPDQLPPGRALSRLEFFLS